MAKPYRRKKGKGYVGNYRVSVGGKDLNLDTKNAEEAHRRARLAVAGKWPPVDAAAAAAQSVLDPAEVFDGGGAPLAVGDTEVNPEAGAGSHPQPAVAPPANPPDLGTAPPPEEPLNSAGAAAADEATSEQRDAAAAESAAEKQAQVDAEMSGIMSELTGGASGADLLDAVCDGAAAGLLWAERVAIELGWKWTLTKRTGKVLKASEPGMGTLPRKALKVGLKGYAVIHFPDLASKLTPGVAVALGLVMGAGATIMGGQLVDANDPAKVVSVVDAFTAAQAQATQPAATPATA